LDAFAVDSLLMQLANHDGNMATAIGKRFTLQLAEVW
jgi:hypothetical protein